ncbi:MAG: L,D-transpeptidase/peptidoglycan binding protein [Blautia sp.]|nr:L,D-transpeptidase/peptidoglycan binding protein [Blautia sp.]
MKKKVMITIILLLLISTGGGYAYGVWYFSRHFMPGSTVNGYNCSYMTADEAERLMNREAEAFALAIETKGKGREAITAHDVGLRYASDGSIEKMIRDQNLLSWFLEFNQEHAYDLSRSITFNDSLMNLAVSSLKCMNPSQTIRPKDAAITEYQDRFVITPEVEGNALDSNKVKQCIIQAMSTGKVLLKLEEENCYLHPSVYADDPQLVENCDNMNRMADTIITYDFGDSTAQIDREYIKSWFIQDAEGYVKIDASLAQAYLQSLAQSTDTVGTTRNFNNYKGETIQVYGGDFGYILDVEEETKTLVALIQSGSTQVREPAYKQMGMRRSGMNDIGYTYVEISIADQKLVYYQDGVPLIETDCASGNLSYAGWGTPSGVYKAGVRESPKLLMQGFLNLINTPVPQLLTEDLFTSSADAIAPPAVSLPDNLVVENGFIKYATVFCWMPFATVGISEGVNRSSYGGSPYSEDRTAGNVEIPYEAATALYGVFTEGLPVVVY